MTGIAHGGAGVARVAEEGGRVVFVRHAIPGERVVVEVTEGGDDDRFWRADAVEVRVASPDRVPAPCAVAGPGGCGGCDFQHVALARQRDLKAEVVAEQLRRLAALEVPVTVEAVAGDEEGLRWRTRVRFAQAPDGRRGMRRHRSHDVVPVDDCLIAREDARQPGPGEPPVQETVVVGNTAARFAVAADGFWQVHPGAAVALVAAVQDGVRARPGERVLDLYAGVGLFARFLGEAVGPGGTVLAIEGDPVAARHATDNLAGLAARVEVRVGAVRAVLDASSPDPVDIVVLDPPREGARRPVVEQVVARRPRVVAYVACDPAALARDVAVFAEHGYDLVSLRAFDLFPMTHHVEAVAVLAPRE